MKLILLRHGIAVEFGTPGYSRDSERPLTPEGRRKTRRIAGALAKLDLKPDAILTSPYVRAHQTADILATALRCKKRLRICNPLACGGDARQLVADLVKHHSQADSLLLVGHEPDLSHLASLLLAGQAEAVPIEMKKGGLCVLDVADLHAGRCATLQWLVPPKVLIASS